MTIEECVANKAFLTRDAKVYSVTGLAIFDAARFENGESFWSNSDGFVARLKRAYQAFLKEFRRARDHHHRFAGNGGANPRVLRCSKSVPPKRDAPGTKVSRVEIVERYSAAVIELDNLATSLCSSGVVS